MKMEYTPDQINGAIAKQTDMRIMFINQILLISSAVFGLLVSLHTDISRHNQIAFAMSLLLLVFGILLLSIGLFGYVKIQEELTRSILVQAVRQYDGMTPSRAIVPKEIWAINRKCEKYSYWILISSIFSLIWYALL